MYLLIVTYLAIIFLLLCTASSGDIVKDGPVVGTVPDEADFLYAMATVPGYVSYRSKSRGSWFITSLVRMLEKFAKT